VNQSDIDRIFDSHEPVDDMTGVQHDLTRAAFKKMALMLSNLPDGREKSIVFTKLEEASFFAHAAIARPRP
jgi:hypothetical protein